MTDRRANLRHLEDMSVEVMVELGRKKMKLGEVRALKKQDVIDFDKLAGEAFDVRINDVLFAEGEIAVVTDIMACRLTRLVEPHAEEEEGEEDDDEEDAEEDDEEAAISTPESEAKRRQMILVSAGPFNMGSRSGDAPARESPVHKVYLKAFYIDPFPVTNLDYREFVLAAGHTAPMHWSRGNFPLGMENHPVVNVSWHDALAYATWAGKRLPTEAEWEKAARGSDERPYPWGARFVEGERCNNNNIYGTTTPVDEFPDGRSPYGVWDMAGNAHEWCADYFDEHYYRNSPNKNPQGPVTGEDRVLRSCFFGDVRSAAQTTRRVCAGEGEIDERIGFRCTMDT